MIPAEAKSRGDRLQGISIPLMGYSWEAMTNIKPIQPEHEAAIRQDAQDMQGGQNTKNGDVCSNQTMATRQRMEV